MISLTEKDILRFKSKIAIRSTGCWEWTGSLNHGGYGEFQLRYHNYRAHRIAWIIANGDIPEDMQVLHRCDNRLCINIEHLYLGRHEDNMNDMVIRLRAATGEYHGRAKLKESQVTDILNLYFTEDAQPSIIANKYNVSKTVIRNIVNGKLWKPIYKKFMEELNEL